MIPTITSTTHWWKTPRNYTIRGLIFVLVPFLLACENDDFLSLPTTPGQPNLEILFTRIPVPFTLVQLDSVNTTNRSQTDSKRLLAGSETSEVGTVMATSFMDFTVGPKVAVGDTADYESLELELLYERSYGTVQSVSQMLDVRPLAQPFDDNTADYFASSTLDLKSNSLGTVTVTTKLTGATDTLRFRLDDALGQQIFDLAKANDSTVLSGPQFREFFPGIALVPAGSGDFVGSFSPESARIIMNFTDADNERQEHTFTLRRYFSGITEDFSGTALAEFATTDGAIVPTDGNFYLQSGSGVTPKISMDSVLTFIQNQSDDTQKVLLNRVDINIGLDDPADTINAPLSIAAYEFDPGTLARDTVGRDQRSGDLLFRGLFSDQSTAGTTTAIPLSDARYRLPITNYVRGLIASDTLNRELIILADDFESSTAYIATGQDSVYLNVYYSLLK